MNESKEFSRICSDQKIQQWLEDVFQADIPSFEETPEFIESLQKIMDENEAAEKDARTMIKAETSMKDLYNEKAEELQLVTDFIQLNSETRRRVQSLALLAENMRLKEPSLTNFVLGMTEIEDKKALHAEKELINTHHVSVFSKRIKHIMMMNDQLRRSLGSITKVVDMQKTHDTETLKSINYFDKKTKEVKEKIEFLKERLAEAEYDEKLRHSVLLEEAQELEELEDRKKSLENKLQAYRSLDPNFKTTFNAVVAKEEELVQLNKHLEMLLQPS